MSSAFHWTRMNSPGPETEDAQTGLQARPQPMKAPEAYHFTRPPRARRDGLCPVVGYVEDFFWPRTKPGRWRVSARRGWVGVMVGIFSILCQTERKTAKRSLSAIVLFFKISRAALTSSVIAPF